VIEMGAWGGARAGEVSRGKVGVSVGVAALRRGQGRSLGSRDTTISDIREMRMMGLGSSTQMLSMGEASIVMRRSGEDRWLLTLYPTTCVVDVYVRGLASGDDDEKLVCLAPSVTSI
jgi:hypothetical protein